MQLVPDRFVYEPESVPVEGTDLSKRARIEHERSAYMDVGGRRRRRTQERPSEWGGEELIRRNMGTRAWWSNKDSHLVSPGRWANLRRGLEVCTPSGHHQNDGQVKIIVIGLALDELLELVLALEELILDGRCVV